MGLRSIKVKGMIMRETVVDIIKRLDRDLVCTINTLASIDYEKHSGRVFSCRDCMFKDTISIGLCPISLLSQFHIVR